MEDNRVKVNPQDVLNFLADGKTREEIREHYNLTKSDMTKMFQHPDLKGRKTKKAPGFVFETPSEEISGRNNETNAVEDEQVNGQYSPTTDGTQSEEQNLDSGVADAPSQWAN